MTIYQPRRQNVSTFDISKDNLYRWADEVLKPTAELAFAGDGNFLCGEWCGFCKARNECRARAEANLQLAQYDFKLPPLLTDTEIEVILSKLDELISWASDIKEYALQQALSGKEWNGWKLVEGRSNRKYSNEAAVIQTVEEAGFDPYEKKLLGVTAMDLVQKAIEMDTRSRTELTAAMKKLTALDNPNSVQQMKQWLSENGLETDTLGKKAVAELLKTASPELRTVLTLRQQLAKSSVRKYQTMERAA